MPRLPEAIWRRRLDNEFAELSASGAVFKAGADKTEYVLELSARGIVLQGGREVPVNSHRVRIRLLRDYPYPGGLEVTWLSPIFHPNIRPQDGRVCIQLLNAWSEGLSLVSLAAGLKQLLENPNPKDPLNKEAAKYFLEKQGLAPSAGQPLARRLEKPTIVL